jgi:hypothetical protein
MVAFAGIIPSTHVFNAGYFCRVGVVRKHCGHGLQLRLMRAMEARASDGVVFDHFRHHGQHAFGQQLHSRGLSLV